MLRTADVKVNVAPIFVCLFRHKSIVVARIHIAQIICRRASETRHCAKFVRIAFGCVPVFGTSQWRLASLRRQEFINFGQFKRQLVLIEHMRNAVFVVYRERLAPIALTTEDSIAQTIVHFYLAYAFFFDKLLCRGNGFFHFHSVEIQLRTLRIYHFALFCVKTLFRHVASLNKRHYGQIEMTSESIVTAVVGWHCHDCARAVACKHIVAYPHRYFLACKRIHGIRS